MIESITKRKIIKHLKKSDDEFYMNKLISVIFFCATCCVNLNAQYLKVAGSKIDLPNGDILGAAFYEGVGGFLVQQYVLIPEKDKVGFRTHRQLSSWDINNRSVIAITEKAFDEQRPRTQVFPCGRVEASAKLRRVFICSADSHIEVLDPDDLSTVGKIARQESGIISDFAVDDLRSRLFVLTTLGDGSSRLIAYSLPDGQNKENETVLPVTNSMPTRMRLALDLDSGRVGIAVNVNIRNRSNADIYTCIVESGLACTKIIQTDELAQISFLGKQILAATNNFANNKKECLLTIDPAAGSMSREYCSPSTGVHYAVGVVNGRYVAAFTGISKYNWFTEETRSVSSSFSVWRAGNHKVAAVAKDSTDYGSFQDEIEIAASRTEPLFITYHRMSNVLFLYTITEHE